MQEVANLRGVWLFTEHLLWDTQQDMNMGKATQSGASCKVWVSGENCSGGTGRERMLS